MIPPVVTEKSRIYILAGNMKQAESWSHEHKIARPHWTYARVDTLRGVERPFYVIVGSFLTTNNECHAIIDELRARQPIELRPAHLQMFQSLSDKHMLHMVDEFIEPPQQRLRTFKTLQ